MFDPELISKSQIAKSLAGGVLISDFALSTVKQCTNSAFGTMLSIDQESNYIHSSLLLNKRNN